MLRPEEIPPEIRQTLLQHQLEQAARVQKFGHGHPIVSWIHQGCRMVAVRSTVYYSKSWKTFHDFLGDYIKMKLTRAWGNAEIAKPFEDRHPIMQWYHLKCDFDRIYIKIPGKVHSGIMTGPVKAYFSLAHDLYTLDHHGLLSEKLLRRLKIRDQYQGARHEIYTYAAFIRAGFDIVPENEADSSDSHCEFAATHKQTGLQYSVEAKSRHRPGVLGHEGAPQPVEEITADAYRLLQEAFKKTAAYDRIVFIDINVPPIRGRTPFDSKYVERLFGQLNRLEEKQFATDPWPAAFLFFTNHPNHFVAANDQDPGHTVLFTGFNMPDFKKDDSTVIAKYPAIMQLYDSVLNHALIPHEF